MLSLLSTAPCLATERELTPEEFARVLHTIDATRHELPRPESWVSPDSAAVLLGFTHVMNSAIPGRLRDQLRELKKLGVTDLVIESPEGSEDCRNFQSIARGEPPDSGFFEYWQIAYGPDYYSLLQSAQSLGMPVLCGDRPIADSESQVDSNEPFHQRNEFIAWRLLEWIESGRKPLLLIGAYHVNPLQELLEWLASRRGGFRPKLDTLHASEIDGRYAPSEGLLYPDIDQMLRAFGKIIFFRAHAIERFPEDTFGADASRCLTCPD